MNITRILGPTTLLYYGSEICQKLLCQILWLLLLATDYRNNTRFDANSPCYSNNNSGLVGQQTPTCNLLAHY